MKGYIQYNDDSIFSLSYPNPLYINEKQYPSPLLAIQDNNPIFDVAILHVKNHMDIYSPYKDYIFSGTYSNELNKAIQLLMATRIEISTMDKYIYLLDSAKYNLELPPEYSISILRNVYTYEKVTENIYKPISSLNKQEKYRVYLIDGILLYIGKQGGFLLLNNIDIDLSSVLSKLAL